MTQVLDILLRHLVSDVIRLPNCERYNRQCRICRRSGSELAAVRNKQVFDVVSLTPFVANPIFLTRALTTGAKIMRGCARRRPNDAGRTDGVVDHCTSLVGVIAHRNIVCMIVKMNIRNRYAEPIFLYRVKRHTIACLRHIFAYKPHAGHIFIGFHDTREVAAPSVEIGTGSESSS